MCGITGYWTRRGDPAAWLRDLSGSVEALRNRGPDDSGVWVRPGGRVALGHTRLSILDLSPLGHQPMHSSDGTLTMVFNGEVYNFATIRAELESLGHRFRSTGDSEVVLAAIQQWGMKAVDRFVGSHRFIGCLVEYCVERPEAFAADPRRSIFTASAGRR